MDRRTEELEYVLQALHRTRQELVANPRLFEPGVVERIDKAIAAIEEGTQLKAAWPEAPPNLGPSAQGTALYSA